VSGGRCELGISGEGNAIGRVRLSVLRRLFSICLSNQLAFDLDLCMCIGHNRIGSPKLSQGHMSR